MKLYKEVLIESVEQAEALPIGTVSSTATLPIFMKVSEEWWVGVHGPDSDDDEKFENCDAMGITALVPIEAEEELSKTYPDGEPYYTHTVVGGGREEWRYIVRDDEGNLLADVTDEVSAWEATRKTRRRYVTPWEEA